MKICLWRVIYIITVAFFIEVGVNGFGLFNDVCWRIGGISASIIAFSVLYFYANQGYSWKKKPKIIDSIKPQINKERAFQFELSELQREYDKCDTFLIVIGVLIGFSTAIGVLRWTLINTISPFIGLILVCIGLIPIIPAIGLVFAYEKQYKNKIPEKTLFIKNEFIAELDRESGVEAKKLETLTQILTEQQKANACLLRLEEELKNQKRKASDLKK